MPSIFNSPEFDIKLGKWNVVCNMCDRTFLADSPKTKTCPDCVKTVMGGD